MIDTISSGLTQALTEVDLAVCGTYRGQTDLRNRLENIQTIIATLPQLEKSTLNTKQIQEAHKKLKSIEETIISIQKRVRKMEELITRK